MVSNKSPYEADMLFTFFYDKDVIGHCYHKDCPEEMFEHAFINMFYGAGEKRLEYFGISLFEIENSLQLADKVPQLKAEQMVHLVTSTGFEMLETLPKYLKNGTDKKTT